MDKKTYIRPELINHGKVATITLQGSEPNADVPSGNNNTAFPASP